MAELNFSKLSEKQLLQAYCALMRELRDRKIVRSSNNPIADYTESLVCRSLGLNIERNSKAGYDATHLASNQRVQIKGRRLTKENSSTQLSIIRNLDKDPFDVLAAVMYSENLEILYAAIIPIDVVRAISKRTDHSNGHVLMFRRDVLDIASVKDITMQLSAT